MPSRTTQSTPAGKTRNAAEGPPLSISLGSNLEEVRSRLGNSPDLVIRMYESVDDVHQVAAVYFNAITDLERVEEYITHGLSFGPLKDSKGPALTTTEMFRFVQEKALSTGKLKTVQDLNSLLEGLLSGDTMILFNGLQEAISASTSGGETRAVSEAATQVAIRGSKESFTESLGTNIALVRRRVKTPDLWVETMTIGNVTKTDVSIMHIHGLAEEETLQTFRKKLQAIDVDSILESGYIEQLIEDKRNSPFPTVYNTERPDSVAGNLLEGRIALFVDGTPFVLIVPSTFFMFFHTVEDYYQRYDISTLIRILRFICLLISLFGPAIFVAALNFHQEMIPTPLLINLAAQREGVPFPAFVEALMMEFTFEIIREAGIRMPSPIGQTVSIIGGLVLGQAAVQAGIVSPAMVIVVSLTGISSFATPAFNMALSIRVLRFVIMFVAAFMGLYGIAIIGIMLVAHICSLRSLGVPYLAPLAPFVPGDQKDLILRTPLHFMKTRKRQISGKHPHNRQDSRKRQEQKHED
ncbi:spore germination protein [Paenibacillus sp. PK3_47]|uniref:spore germination protein n=1 Tax=Paenibacillus sp. PK3_47 TaxID=2072642 RepID=UPI00201E7135|nr:spore germination protein [Paenibacillus sp. PK3_47]UQZ32475.1 spore germination protein [Paenibacillus sp. PK3_47]